MLKNQVEGWLSFHAKDVSVLNQVSNNPSYNEFWAHFDTVKKAHHVNVPALLYTGWYDTFLQGTLDAYTARQNLGAEGARGKQKLWIGPWTHYWPLSDALGDFKVPAEGKVPPHDLSPQRWFDYHLKGQKNGVEEIPTVTYYVMGPFDGAPTGGNRWRTAKQWPVPAQETSFYLTHEKKLSTIYSETNENKFPFTHDPLNPVPTLGGRNLFLESGAKDQRPIESRDDLLVFTTIPFEKELEVTGLIGVKLFFKSDSTDTDVAVRLSDVYPDGRSILIADGICRTVSNAEAPHEITVDLWSSSFVIAKGHSIRISIAGSNYPRFEINKKTGFSTNAVGNKVTNNTIYTGGRWKSRLILPVVRDGDKWLVYPSPD